MSFKPKPISVPSTFVLCLLALGFVAGFSSSLLGIGGGLVIVPVLVFLFGFDQKSAQGVAVLLLCLPVAALGGYTYYKAGNTNWQVTLIIASTFLVGSFYGGRFVNQIDTATLKKIFAVFLILVGIKYLFFDSTKKALPPANSSIESTVK